MTARLLCLNIMDTENEACPIGCKTKAQTKTAESASSKGVSLFSYFAIVWTASFLCLLLHIYLLNSQHYLPQELYDKATPEALTGVVASKPIYTRFSFLASIDFDKAPATPFFNTQEQPQERQAGSNPVLDPALDVTSAPPLELAEKPQDNHVKFIRDIIRCDTKLINQGEVYSRLTAQQAIEYKHEYDRRNSEVFTTTLPKTAILLAIIIICFGACLSCLRGNFFERTSRANMTITIVILHTLMLILSHHVFMKFLPGSSLHFYTLLPLALFPILGAYLLGIRFGACISMLLSVITPVLLNDEHSFSLLVYSLVISIIGIFSFHHVTKRNGFLKGGLVIAATLILLNAFFIWQLQIDIPRQEWIAFFKGAGNPPWFTFQLIVAALINGFIILVAMFVLPTIFERWFDVITPVALRELAAEDHPLLEQLYTKAPGTHEHAKAVAAMAANAAQAIGANKLLAKVCGLFHDIGKLKEPACFIENIGAGQPNPHDELTPQESAEKIKEHVIYGKQLAKKYGLQRPIMEAIACHHGNDLIAFFYNKALKEAELNNSKPPNIEDFQYKQEQPQRKEVVIVEIADICEAASRAEFINWKSIDLETIKPFVDKLIMAKMQRRQFDHADITLAELSKIADSIANELCVIYHSRAKYSDRKQYDPQVSVTTSFIPQQLQQNDNNLNQQFHRT